MSLGENAAAFHLKKVAKTQLSINTRNGTFSRKKIQSIKLTLLKTKITEV